MTLPAGTRLGPYEILAPIGAGGMGEVYRANDTRLDRTVAIKVLGEGVAGRSGSRERFEREARTVAGLSHPHICALHDVGRHDGVDFLVMEHLEGETLARRLSRGALPVEVALRHAVEIAEALAEAHRHGVIHRDLKPGNVMLTRSGAKLLDFGLAKLRREESTQSPSEAKTLTAENVLAGTLPYMAPEQLEGRPVDARTDLFALGAVLYEMLTGVRAFAGESQASLIASIVSGEVPPMTSRQPLTPAPLDVLVGQCLRKNPDERWQSAHDVALRLREIAKGPGARRDLGASLRWWHGLALAAGLTLVLLAGLAAGRFWLPRPGAEKRPRVLRGQLELPAEARLTSWGFVRTEIALSPDGTALVWSGSPDGTLEKANLYRRELDETEVTLIPGTEGASQPFFSPDGEWLGFYNSRSAKLCKIPTAGGLAVDLVAWRSEFYGPMGPVWTPEGRIILGTEDEGLVWIPAEGGRPHPVTTMDPERETGHRLPRLLPGGEALLFTVMPHLWGVRARVEAVDLRTGERQVVVEDAADGRYLQSGHLVFLRQGVLMAAPFSPEKLRLEGPPVPILDDVRQALNVGNSSFNSGAGQYAVADSGLLIFASGGIYDDPPAELVLVDRSGRVEALPGFDKPLATSQARFSPDGRQIAFVEHARSGLLWLFDIERQTHRALSKEGIAGFPVWRPDGRQLAVGWSAAGSPALWLVPTDGVGPWQALNEAGAEALPPCWSPDGRWLAFVRQADNNTDILLYGFEDRQSVPFLATGANELSPEISPDGRWMAFVSDESGRREVYVTSFPNPGQTLVVSNEGASAPAWSRDGRTIFYYASVGRQLKAVALGDGPRLTLGRPETVLNVAPNLVVYYQPYRGYDIHPDGRRFLVERRAQAPAQHPITRLHLVQNWFTELEHLSPTTQ